MKDVSECLAEVDGWMTLSVCFVNKKYLCFLYKTSQWIKHYWVWSYHSKHFISFHTLKTFFFLQELKITGKTHAVWYFFFMSQKETLLFSLSWSFMFCFTNQTDNSPLTVVLTHNQRIYGNCWLFFLKNEYLMLEIPNNWTQVFMGFQLHQVRSVRRRQQRLFQQFGCQWTSLHLLSIA